MGGSTLIFRGPATVDGVNSLTSLPGGTIRFGGDLLGGTQNPLAFSPKGNTTLDGSSSAISPQLLEVMSLDAGTNVTAFNGPLAYGTLTLGSSTYVRLVDVSDNSPGAAPEALYVDSVVVPAGCTLDLNGLHLYARAKQISGIVLGGSISTNSDSGPVAAGTPTSAALAVAGELDEWTFFGRAGQLYALAVDTGSGNVFTPRLNYAEVRLLNTVGALVARGSNNVAGQTVALTDVLLPVDGTYRVQVRAPANQPSATGNYQITLWEIAPDVAPLVINQRSTGRIEMPYDVDRWTFTAEAGQQVRFILFNSSAPVVAFSLRGPNGWVGFSNLVGNSGVVILPADGNYTLTAAGTGGGYETAYTFRLADDVIPPRITQHTPAGDIAGTLGSVDVWFSEAIDITTLTPANISIRNPSSGYVAVNSLAQVGLNRWRINFSPQTAVGLYRVTISTNVTDLASNPLAQDYGALTFNLAPVRILLSNVAFSTNQFWSGDAVSIAWNGRNESGAPLLGSWSDGVYLSQDDRWDINDILITTLPHTNGLVSNELYSASANVFVPGALPGNYHLIIRADVFMQEKPPTNQPNNFVATPIQVAVPELTLGTPYADQFLRRGHARYYRVTVPDNADLRVTLDLAAATGATELYLRREAIPTRSVFDVKYSAPFQPDQVVRVPGTQAGTYYLLAYADTLASEPAPFTLLAELLPFALTGVTPNHGGNAGNVTLRLTGSGITSNSIAKLVYLGSNGVPVEVVPVGYWRPNMEWMEAKFDLRGIPPATANVVLLNLSGQSNVLHDAFQIEPGRGEDLQVRIVGPSGIRPGGGPGMFKIKVRNNSNMDAEYVSVTAWVPNDTRVSSSIRGPVSPDNPLPSNEGVVSFPVPRIAVGDEIVLDYEVVVGWSFSGDAAPIEVSAEPLGEEAYLAEFSRTIEMMRLAVLSVPGASTNYPDLLPLAHDQFTWLQFAESRLRTTGYLMSNQSLEQEALRGANVSMKSGLHKACVALCKFVCTIVPAVPKLPKTVTVPLCAAMKELGGCEEACHPRCYVYLATRNCFEPVLTDPLFKCTVVLICLPRPRDPNLITGPKGVGERHFVPRDTVFPYLVEFENQPAAQGAAVQVTITNQLGPELDWQTFALTEIGFAGVKLPVPDGLSHFETRVPFAGWTWNSSNGWHRGQTPLMVDVKAGIDIQSGLITLTLTCSDTNTGALPEDAFAGFLPPNRPETFFYGTNAAGCCGSVDTNVMVQPGQGYVSYTVRPRTNQPSGTVITNAASIYFDWNDPIDTPTVFNTLDAAPPVSTVLPLPAESGRTFLVRWAGQDDPGGSGVASYDVYLSTDGTNYSRWMEGTTLTASYFVGELGGTYRFYSVARDWVGHEQAKPAGPQTFTTVSTNSPIVFAVTNRFLYPNDRIAITNLVAGGLGSGFTFNLGTGTPAGAEVDPTNGVFRWVPSCAQASRTNEITLWVTDRANTNLMDAMTFTVAVGECVVPGLGRLVLPAGESGRVPVNLISSVPLTNLFMTVEAQPDRLTGFTLVTNIPGICTASVVPWSNAVHLLSLSTCSNQFLIGTQQVAWLHFTASTNGPSAFVTLQLDNTVGLQPNGVEVRNFAPQAGRVVVIGEEPLLEAFFETNHLPALMLYAKAGTTNVVVASPNLSAPAAAWTALQSIGMSNLFQWVQPPATNQWMFYRAKRLP